MLRRIRPPDVALYAEGVDRNPLRVARGCLSYRVALYTRAWIEIDILPGSVARGIEVALYTRAWIEIQK